MLESSQVSAFQRIHSDELWHFYTGSSLTVYILEDNQSVKALRLGADLEHGETFQIVVPAGRWFGATVNEPGNYALVGCTVAPGFHFDDFELAKREDLLRQYPYHEALIERLTVKPR